MRCSVPTGRWAAPGRAALVGFSLLAFAGCGSSSAAVPPSSTANTPTTTPAAAVTTVPAASGDTTAAFCADAKNLAALNAQTAKDIAGGVDMLNPGYVSKSMSDSVAQLNSMHVDAPAAIAAAATEYFTAYVAYGQAIASVNFVLDPKDPAERKTVVDATKAYAPSATKDLPLLDAFVTKTCGFTLNLQTAAP